MVLIRRQYSINRLQCSRNGHRVASVQSCSSAIDNHGVVPESDRLPSDVCVVSLHQAVILLANTRNHFFFFCRRSLFGAAPACLCAASDGPKCSLCRRCLLGFFVTCTVSAIDSQKAILPSFSSSGLNKLALHLFFYSE